jgi:hypothetical protein
MHGEPCNEIWCSPDGNAACAAAAFRSIPNGSGVALHSRWVSAVYNVHALATVSKT